MSNSSNQRNVDRLGNSVAGLYEFVKKGDPPVMGITKVEPGITIQDMKRPRMPLPLGK